MEWKPIETAPRDGRMLLLADVNIVSPGWYDPKRAPWVWSFIDNTDDAPTGCCDNESIDRIGVNGWHADNPPTHWMTLPDNPKE